MVGGRCVYFLFSQTAGRVLSGVWLEQIVVLSEQVFQEREPSKNISLGSKLPIMVLNSIWEVNRLFIRVETIKQLVFATPWHREGSQVGQKKSTEIKVQGRFCVSNLVSTPSNFI
jgi:hypothetical protein